MAYALAFQYEALARFERGGGGGGCTAPHRVPRRTSLAPHLSCRSCSGAGVMWGDLEWLRSELSVAITFRHSIVLVNVLGRRGGRIPSAACARSYPMHEKCGLVLISCSHPKCSLVLDI